MKPVHRHVHSEVESDHFVKFMGKKCGKGRLPRCCNAGDANDGPVWLWGVVLKEIYGDILQLSHTHLVSGTVHVHHWCPQNRLMSAA
ncbi:hypothetical protein GCM10009720_09550 [Yaniella flava]|uniref:Uncharacterized protein n=1 Tax=Yaniella flava TaxID=287930 RepID=A0ABP5FSL5_9MICC